MNEWSTETDALMYDCLCVRISHQHMATNLQGYSTCVFICINKDISREITHKSSFKVTWQTRSTFLSSGERRTFSTIRHLLFLKPQISVWKWKILTFLVLPSFRSFSLCSRNLFVHSSLGGSIMASAERYLSEGIWLMGGGRLLRLTLEDQLLLDVTWSSGSLLRAFGHFGFENHLWLPLRWSLKFVFFSKGKGGGGGLNWNSSLGGGPP